MAFDNVTFFEVNLPDEIFTSGSTGEREERATGSETHAGETGDESESGGRSKGKLLLVALVLGGVVFGVQRFRSGGEDEEIEMEYERPGVEVETETDQ